MTMLWLQEFAANITSFFGVFAENTSCIKKILTLKTLKTYTIREQNMLVSFYVSSFSQTYCSPISLAIANIFMKSFKKKATESSQLKPTCSLRYTDHIFIIWPLDIFLCHVFHFLDVFHQHLYSIHYKIQFTKETREKQLTTILEWSQSWKWNRRIQSQDLQDTNRYFHAISPTTRPSSMEYWWPDSYTNYAYWQINIRRYKFIKHINTYKHWDDITNSRTQEK